tara:strand:+ start:998 stop:2800 length:1803 start_codon:yes stop_codon:yes gene_type:complete
MGKLNILILGGNGFIGRHILNKFSKKKNIRLFTTIYKKNNFKISGVKYFLVKNNNFFYSNKSEIYKYSYKYIINCHGYISNSDFFIDGIKVFEQHLSSLINLIFNIKKNKHVSLINLGSSHEYGINKKKIIEENISDPISFYGHCKNFLSVLSKMINKNSKKMNLLHLRLFQIYGEGQNKPRLLPYLINSYMKKEKIKLISPFSSRDFLHIDDFIFLLEELIYNKQNKKFSILNIGSGKSYKIIDIYKKLNFLINGKHQSNPTDTKKNELTLIPDIGKLSSINWSPKITIDEGIIRSLMYEKEKKSKEFNALEYKKPSKISILMNCYNGEKYLRQSIECVINQSYQNWELIFFDNNSNDKSQSILKSYKDDRIKYFKSNKKISLASARNEALKKITGSFVAFLDVDDYWTNNKLLNQISNMIKNKTKASYTNFYIKRSMFPILTKYKNKKLNKNYLYKKFLESYDVGFLTFMISADIIKKNKIKFNSKFEIISDFEFVMKISRITNLSVCNEPLGVYRVHNQSYSSQNISKHVRELKSWINHEKSVGNIKQEAEVKNIYNKINLLEYKNFLKNKTTQTANFSSIKIADKLKTKIKNKIGY